MSTWRRRNGQALWYSRINCCMGGPRLILKHLFEIRFLCLRFIFLLVCLEGSGSWHNYLVMSPMLSQALDARDSEDRALHFPKPKAP